MKFCWEQWCLAECNWNQFQASPMQSSAAVWQFGLERSARGADCDRMIYPLDWGASVGQVQAIDCFSRARRLRTPWNPFTEWSSCIVGRPNRLAMYLFQLQIRRIDHLHSARLLALKFILDIPSMIWMRLRGSAKRRYTRVSKARLPLMTPPLSLRCSSVKRQKGSGGGMFKCQSKVSHLESTQPPLLGRIIC